MLVTKIDYDKHFIYECISERTLNAIKIDLFEKHIIKTERLLYACDNQLLN